MSISKMYHPLVRSRSCLQCILQMLVNLHNRSLVTTSVAVVGCTEYRDHIPVLTPIVSLHDELMRSCDQGQPVVVIECFADVLTKSVPSPSRTDSPSTSVIRITPQQVTHRPLMGHFLDPVQTSDIIQRVNTRAQSSVQAKYLIVNQGGERKIVEEIGKVLPHVRIAIFAQAFVVKAIHLCDLAGFVVTAEDGDARRVSNFEGDE
jgi:hypothetical protein